MGINETNPQADLDIAGDVKVGNSSAVCSSTTEGSIRYNSTAQDLEFCDGSNWLIAGNGGFTCGTSTVDYEGQTYSTVQIDTQCWFAENLNVGTMLVSGSTNPTDNGTIEKWCYNNSTTNCTNEGGLYNWDEMMDYTTTEEAQGICPSGWHIPTHTEMTDMERVVCTSGTCTTDFPYDTTTTGYR